VDALQAAGVPATFLNSSLVAGEGRERLRGLHRGEFRLLYVAPERLMLSGFLEDLKRWNVQLIAIDEAHCISEWGHDFRPEYRQISELRKHFPVVPFMALTATATGRVREDIVNHLKLRKPSCYVASFNRPNLTYRVIAKNKPFDQLTDFLRARPKESGIVYCLSRKATESVAERLNENGIKARPYHAGLTPKERSEHQELFLRDNIRVVCATIAFGMGINKPNVRFVVHYDLPKNIEGYYQETGRAGRDGLPGECVLLFSPGDAVKQTVFIDEKPNPQERQIAREQLHQMVNYAECANCRRAELLAYFGEEFSAVGCGACDNCLSPRATFNGTLSAQKFLSCVYRIREKSGFGVGLNHVVEVLTGADTEKIRKWDHAQLSTYGIGREHNRSEWAAIGRELVRLGYLRQTKEKFSVLEITNEGRDALKDRKKITLTQPVTLPETKSRHFGEITCDEGLFERLRELRKRLADERDVPAYIVFSDVALRQMARNYPGNERDFARISGVGEKKLREFGEVFLDEIGLHLATNPRQIFAEDSFVIPVAQRSSLGDTARETLRRFRAGDTPQEIANARGLVAGTIYGHLATAIEAGEKIEVAQLINPGAQAEIAAAFQRTGWGNIVGARELLGEKYDYGLLRIYRAANNISSARR
jgi:ATP-dependent DNA helicase RecQ